MPEIVEFSETEKHQFLVMKPVSGDRLCDIEVPESQFVSYFADAVKKVQSIPVCSCQFNSDFDIRLSELKFLIESDLAAREDLLEGDVPFDDPRELYDYLIPKFRRNFIH